MGPVSRAVQKNPALVVAINLVLTAVFTYSYMTADLSTTFDDEDFFPDLEEAQASREVSEDYTGEYRVSVLLKAKNGNLLTPAGLSEMLEFQAALEADGDVVAVLENPEVPSANFDNPATMVYTLLTMADSLDALAGSEGTLNATSAQMAGLLSLVTRSQAGLSTVPPADAQNFTAVLVGLSGGLEAMASSMAPDGGDAGAGAGSGDQGDHGGEGGAGASAAEASLDQKMAYFANMSGADFKTRLLSSMSPDPASVAGAASAHAALMTTLDSILDGLDSLTASLLVTAVDPAASEVLIPAGPNGTTVGADVFAAGLAVDISGSIVPMLEGTRAEVLAGDPTAAFTTVSGVIVALSFGLDIMLTRDYRPENGPDGVRAKGTMMSMKLNLDLDDDESLAAEKDIDRVAEHFDASELELSVIGGQIIGEEIGDAVDESMVIVLPLAFGAVIVILALVYRNFFDMGISLSALLFAIIWIYGFGAMAGYSFNPMTTAVPVLIVGLGIDYGIHITMRYREELRSGRTLDRAGLNTVNSVGMALMLATVTTVIAFLSNLISPIGLLKEFGILCAVGIIGSFVTMTTYVPAAKLLRDRYRSRKGKALFTGFVYDGNEAEREERRQDRLAARKASGKKAGAREAADEGAEDGPGGSRSLKEQAADLEERRRREKGKSGGKGRKGKSNKGKGKANKGEGKTNEGKGKGKKKGGRGRSRRPKEAGGPGCSVDNGEDLRRSGVGVKALNRGLGAGAVAAERYPAAVILIVILVTGASAFAAFQLDIRFDIQDFLPGELEISKDIEFMLDEFELAGGQAEQVYILVKGDISQPSVFRAMNDTIANMGDDGYVLRNAGVPEVDTIASFMLSMALPPAQTADLTSSYDPAFAAIYWPVMDSQGMPLPNATSGDIASLYAYLFENDPKDVMRHLHMDDSGPSPLYDGTVMRISVRDLDMDEGKIDRLHQDLLDDKEPLDDCPDVDRAVVTGGQILTNIVMSTLNQSQLMSMIITTIASGIILTIAFWLSHRSAALGFFTTLPVVLVISWVMGTMYLRGYNLNIMTIMIAALSVGLGITYAIHVTHRFMEELEAGADPDTAACTTVTHTGSALFGAMATTVAGFGLLMLSLMPPLQQFGEITALSILYSFISCVFVLPTMLVLWAKWTIRRGKSWKRE